MVVILGWYFNHNFREDGNSLMAKKQREKVKLIETVQFTDLERAKRTVTLAKINLIRIIIGFVFALVATGFTAYGLFGHPADISWLGYTIFCAVPAYLIGGGIFKALKSAFKFAKIGWFLIPMFPADILIAIGFLIFGLFAFFCIPAVFVGLNYIQHKKTLDAAQSYLAQCGYVMSAENKE